MRETLSSFTITKIIPDEVKTTLRSVLLETTADLKSHNGCTIRVDGAAAFQSLLNDQMLQTNGVQLELGRMKNHNKNPVAEKAIQELEKELKRAHPDAASLTPSQLALVTATLNTNYETEDLLQRKFYSNRTLIQESNLHFKIQHWLSNSILSVLVITMPVL